MSGGGESRKKSNTSISNREDSENCESWEVHHDDDYDLDYYVSDETGRTTWTKPDNVFELQ